MDDNGERENSLSQRIEELRESDPQFAAAAPDPEVVAAANAPGLSFVRYLDTLMRGYAERPALARRAGEGYATTSYGELWARVGAIAAAWQADGLAPGDFIATLGFTSPDYAALDLAATRSGLVSVPLQAGASTTQLVAILEETAPKALAASADSLDGAVACVSGIPSVERLVVFDLDEDSHEHRAALAAAREKLAHDGGRVAVETLPELVERGAAAPQAPLFEPAEGEDPLSLLIYTSGSTGVPKGAMYSQRLVSQFWSRTPVVPGLPNISLHYMPLSHSYGRVVLSGTLAAGGIAHFTAKSDLSTLFEDIALARPTILALVPRVCEMLFQESRRGQEGQRAGDFARLREQTLGGRLLVAISGSAPLSPEMRAFMGDVLGFPIHDGYGSTEALGVMRDGIIQRPPVIDYKLADVPELGYFSTDKPHPRGELCIRSASLISGYYKRPEVTAEVFDADGYYKTGDVMAEIAPDHLVYVDRSKNVLKLSQGEFVAVAKLEAAYAASPYVKQIFVYGNSERSYLLAVVVPNEEALGLLEAEGRRAEAKPLIAASLQKIAKAAGLQSYEVPRDFLIETEPFTTKGGLLSEVGKLLRPKLKAKYGEALEARYAEIEQGQEGELRELRAGAEGRPVVETVVRAAAALSGTAGAEIGPDANFADLGGDSLSALSLANLLHEIFAVEVPVRIIIGPTASLGGIAKHIEAQRAGATALTAASTHGAGATTIRASDLKLEKFLEADLLAAARSLPAAGEPRTVLLTGANGWLGRFLALEQLERLAALDESGPGGTLICLVRGRDAESARARIEEAFDSDPALRARFDELAEGRLEVIPGDVGEPKFGLDDATWGRLAAQVDDIVHSAALVNHVLPYNQLFGPNVVGTAEIIRLAFATKLKPVTYLSTVAVAAGVEPAAFEEDGDIRAGIPERRVDEGYANGYGNSKWAGEVLLREAHELAGLPVAVFRSDMILAHRAYTGQLNVPDQFTRLILSLLATGIAPKSFYRLGADGTRQRAHYDGIPVDFTAEAITTLGARPGSGFHSYDVFNPHHDGIGLDEFVDWLIDAGHPIRRIDDHKEWFSRFETAVRALPERQRQHSLLPLLHAYAFPHPAVDGSVYPTGEFQGAVKAAQVGGDHDVPHLGRELIVKYANDLKALDLL